MENAHILVINPGSLTTKIAVYRNNKPLFIKTITHSNDELEKFTNFTDQYQFRKKIILNELHKAEVSLEKIRIVIGRGGIVKPIESGVYEVNEKLKRDLIDINLGDHASNLGGLIADDIAASLTDAKAYIADPVVVDELGDLARISGHPLFQRKSIFHALNQKAVARSFTESILRKYEDVNLIIVHLGGGITIGAHEKGRVIDVNQGLDGEGPFSPERSGTLPMGDLVNLCFSGQYTKRQVKRMITGDGGLKAYLQTNSAYDVEQLVKNDNKKAKLLYKAMAYQVAKAIGEMFTVLKCDVDAILITGGIAHSHFFVNQIIERVFKIAPIYVYPGEDEMKSLASNALKVMTGEIKPTVYDK